MLCGAGVMSAPQRLVGFTRPISACSPAKAGAQLGYACKLASDSNDRISASAAPEKKGKAHGGAYDHSFGPLGVDQTLTWLAVDLFRPAATGRGQVWLRPARFAS